jgi:plasmid stabilization system protein ParE
MGYAYRILPRAEIDARHIYDWISERSPDGARRWWLAFEDVCKRGARNPFGFSLAPEAELTGRDIRQMLFKTPRGRYYRALYVVVDDEVRIVRVRGPGQPDLSPDELT